MDKLERLTNLLLVLLSAERPLTLDEIVHTVEGYPGTKDAFRQAFERDKRLLREQGIDVSVESLPGGGDQIGYRIPPDTYYLPDLGLTADEQQALNLALAAVQVDEAAGRDASWKLGVPGAPGTMAGAPVGTIPSAPSLPVLHEAIRTRSAVTFVHRGVQRVLEPYGLLFRDGFWYVVGRDRDRDAVRSFRIDRITGTPELGGTGSFEIPDGVDWRRAMPDEPWSIGSGPATDAQVVVDAVYARMTESAVGSARVVERRADGSVVLRIPVVNVDLFRSWVLEMLGHAEVVEPSELRDEVASWVRPLAGGK